MGRFARVIHHIDMKDVKRKHLEETAAKKLKEERDKKEKELIKEISRKYKSNWKTELSEKMTTGAVFTTTVAPAEDDGTVTQISPIDAASFTPVKMPEHIGQEGGVGDDGVFDSAFVGTVIRDSGSGTGSGGGFNVGGQYLAFQGTGAPNNNARFASLGSIDSTKIDTLTITAIVGNDSNGGEDPDLQSECLFVLYKTPTMERAESLQLKFVPPYDGEGDGIIIKTPLDGQDGRGINNGGLNEYSIKIPDYARAKDTVFVLYQNFNSGSGYDNYGITDIKFQRKTPLNVVVPLDDPQAVSFIRVGTDEGDPKKRKKKLNDQLLASDEYVAKSLAAEFPGTGTRVGGDDPFASAKIKDDVKPSPIGKAEVKKSFSDFSADSATAEPEPEKITPSTQTTMNPTNDEGEKITVKTVGAKNSGIVQGADAANIDSEEPEPEPTEPEVTEPEEIKPEEIKASEKEKQNKTSEEIKSLEQEKAFQVANEKMDALDRAIQFDTSLGLESFRKFAQLSGMVINTGITVFSGIANILGFKGYNDITEALGKIKNSISAAQSVMSGKVVNFTPLPQEMTAFVNSLKVDEFSTKQAKNKNLNKIMISDVRHEYADDNIYVKDGKIYQNGNGKDKRGLYATPLADEGFKGMDVHGQGYAQMIIPKDGSEPYLHYYDHNYHNLNSIDDLSVSGGIIQSAFTEGQKGAAFNQMIFSLSNLIHNLKKDSIKLPNKLRNTLIGYFSSFDQVFEGLQNTSSIEGFPPGIHGSALTDFKVPLSKLPKETQEMIAAHPLSWTPERVANMSEEEIYEQFYSVMKTEADYDDYYYEYMSDITRMSTEPVNTVPYAVAMQEIDEIVEQYENDLLQKYGEGGWEEFTESDQFFAAERAAQKDLETLETEEQNELDEIEKTIGLEAQMALYDKLVKPLYDSVGSIVRSGGSVSKATMDKLGRQYDKYKKQADRMDKDFQRKQSEIKERYRDQREPIENIAYAQVTSLREPVDDSPFGEPRWKVVNYDGDESSGADYTALDGTVYKGRNTYYDEYYNQQEQIQSQFEALYNPVQKLEKYVTANYVREAKIKEFGEKYKSISGESWTPAKKGTGKRTTPDKPKPKPKPRPKPRDPYAGLDEPIIGSSADDDDDDVKIAGTFDLMKRGQVPFMTKDQVDKILVDPKYQKLLQDDPDLLPILQRMRAGRSSNIQVAHYQPRGNDLLEKYARPQPRRDLFERLKQKQFFNPKDIKPVFPENPPPQLDPKTGMHPEYGKTAKRYRKLDPISANAMPPTGDPETDAVVDKQRTKPKPKLFNKLKKHTRKGLTDK